MGKTKRFTTAGINIRWPWSELIVSGKKKIETRGYPIPSKFIGKYVAIIETSAPNGNGQSTRVVGLVKFSGCYQYNSKKEWMNDQKKHLVKEDNPLFGFRKDTAKWGWEIASAIKLNSAQRPPNKKGIRYAKRCEINFSSVDASEELKDEIAHSLVKAT